MSILATTIDQLTTHTTILRTKLSLEKVQILSALAILFHGNPDYYDDPITLSIEGATLTSSEGQSFTWNDEDQTTVTRRDMIPRVVGGASEPPYSYVVTEDQGYVVVRGKSANGGDSFNATFKDGMLESMDSHLSLIHI